MKRTHSRLTIAVGLLTVGLISTPAFADKNYSTSYSNRSLTLSRGMHNSILRLGLEGRNNLEDPTSLYLQGDQGISDNLTVGAGVPLTLTPEFDFGDLDVHGTFLLIQGPVDIGLYAQTVLPTNTDLQLRTGVPVRLFVGNFIKIEGAALFHVAFRGGDDGTVVSLEVPLEFSINITNGLYGAVKSGVILEDFDSDFYRVPFGLEGGYTIAVPGGGPFVDVFAGFNLPQFVSAIDTVKAFDVWNLYVGGRLFFDFF